MKNIAGLMKQAAQMQKKMEEMQASWRPSTIEGVAGAGMVAVTLNGKGELQAVRIDPKLADPAEMEMLQDLIVAAHADAQAQARGGGGRGDAEGHRRPEPAGRDEAAVLTARA